MTDLISVTPIGLIEAPDLAGPLTEAGLTVVTGTGFRDSVRTIRERSQLARSADQVPVIIARWGESHVGMAAWLNSISGHTPPGKHTVVLAGADDQVPTITGAEIVQLPAELSAVVKAAGFGDHPAFGGLIVAADGQVQWIPDVDSSPFQMPDFDFGDEFDGPAASAAPMTKADPTPPTTPPTTAPAVPDWARAAAGPAAPARTPPADLLKWATGTAVPAHAGPAQVPDRAGPHTTPPAAPASAAPDHTPPDTAFAPPAIADPDPLPSLTAEAPGDPWSSLPPPAGHTRPAPDADIGGDLMDLMSTTSAAVGGIDGPVRRRGQHGTLVISWAGKGGVAKTSIALALAQRAGKRCPDLRVTVIDANRGQADVAKYLRFRPGVTIPGIYDAAVSGEPARAFLTAEVANQLRPGRWFDELHFHLVAGPRNAGEAHPDVVTPEVYAATIEAAQVHCDLVIVDTQIIEEHDTSGLIDGLIVPLLATPGVWGIATTDTSGVGVRNLATRLQAMSAAGVGRERMLMVANKADVDFSDDEVRAAFAPYTTSLERINYDRSVVEMMNAGRIPADHAVYAYALDRMLHQITGRPEFAPQPTSRRSLFGRRARNAR